MARLQSLNFVRNSNRIAMKIAHYKELVILIAEGDGKGVHLALQRKIKAGAGISEIASTIKAVYEHNYTPRQRYRNSEGSTTPPSIFVMAALLGGSKLASILNRYDSTMFPSDRSIRRRDNKREIRETSGPIRKEEDDLLLEDCTLRGDIKFNLEPRRQRFEESPTKDHQVVMIDDV